MLWWIVTQHERKRRDALAYMADPRWSHIRFVRLTSTHEVKAFADIVEKAAASAVVE